MKVLGRDLLTAFAAQHADSRAWIAGWLADVGASDWGNSQDVKARYRSASFLAGNIVMFNVHGNAYRMETLIDYAQCIVRVRWIGTHEKYTKRMRQHGK